MNFQLREQIGALVKSRFLPRPVPQVAQEGMKIKAREVSYNEDGASNGGGSTITLCLNGQAHLTVNHSWHETWDRGDNFDQHSYSAQVGPCNCQDYREVTIPDEHARLIQEFLRSGQVQTQKADCQYEYDALPHLRPERYWHKLCEIPNLKPKEETS